MKKTKKVLALVLSLMMLLGMFSLVSFASEESVSAKFLCQNVAGLPDFKALIGKGDKDIAGNEKKIGKIIENGGFDVVAVQEDFGYHKELVSELKSYNFQTKSTGTIPGGDGLGVFTKSAKIYDATRTPWNTAFGDISEGDTLTPKGILYTVLDMGNGIYVDFYNLHADAFGNEGSSLARADQYKQLMALVEKNSKDRPVIITGDFNTSLSSKADGDNGADERAMYEVIVGTGFKDAWIELENGGDYVNFGKWHASGIPSWGNWDSVEKYYYRNGGGVEITASDFEYFAVSDENGAALSDHNGAVCNFTFTKTADFREDTRAHSVKTQSDASIFFNRIKWIMKDLSYIFAHLDEVLALIK